MAASSMNQPAFFTRASGPYRDALRLLDVRDRLAIAAEICAATRALSQVAQERCHASAALVDRSAALCLQSRGLMGKARRARPE